MTSTLRRSLGALLLLTLVLVACGDDDDDGLTGGIDDQTTTTSGEGDGDDEERDEIIDALADEFASGFASSGAPPISDEEAHCAAEAMVDELGLERLAEIGLETQGELTDLALEEDEANGVSSAIVDCLDVEAILTAQLTASGLDDDTASCIASELAEGDLFAEIVATVFTGADPSDSPELTNAVQEATAGCS